MEKKTYKTYHILKSKLQEFVKNNSVNKSVIKEINSEFAKKGLKINRSASIFNNTLELDNLNDNELIALTKGAFAITGEKIYDPAKNFSKLLLNNFNNYHDDTEELSSVVIHNVVKIDDYNYTGRLPYKDTKLYIENSLIIYNEATQRNGVLKQIGTSDVFVKDIDLNTDSVNEISNMMINDKYEENQIILGVMLNDNNDPDIDWQPKYEDVFGDLVITPHYDINEKNFTSIAVLDGWHRIQGAIKAIIKGGKDNKVNGAFDVRIVVRDVQESKRITSQAFKRSDCKDKDHLQALDIDNNYVQFVDNMCKLSCTINNIPPTFEDCMVENKQTYKMLFVNILKEILNDLDVSSLSVRRVTSKKIAHYIDELSTDVGLFNINIYAYYMLFANDIVSGRIGYDEAVKILNKNYKKLEKQTEKKNKISDFEKVKREYENLVEDVE